MARILIADRLSERRNVLCTFLRGDEHIIIPVSDDDEALRVLREVHPELLVAEGTVSGAKLLSETKEFDPDTAVIMILSGPPTVDQIVRLMDQGVSDVLVSPLDVNDVRTKVERALSQRPGADAALIRFHELVGSSRQMQQVFRRMLKAAAVDSPVLIVGEKGTGKRLAAEQIHQLSGRKDRPFATVHCAGLPPAELESELFGHEAGAFSWAPERRRGPLESCDGGTVCLEEPEGLTVPLQAKLLRFLEEEKLQRLGGETQLSADVRIIAIVGQDLIHLVQEGVFRSDLYFRLNTIAIEIPPLRTRVSDIPELVDLFLSRYDVQIAGEATEILMNYAWPGNVDELKNAVEQAVNICDNNRIELKNLPSRILRAVASGSRKYKFTPRQKENGP
jgi:DNA-binding NtrC family response regulator